VNVISCTLKITHESRNRKKAGGVGLWMKCSRDGVEAKSRARKLINPMIKSDREAAFEKAREKEDERTQRG